MYQIYILLFDSGHYYIGRSKDYRRRYTRHKTNLLFNKHPNRFMQSVYDLYGTPKCILLMHCIDYHSIEQILIDYNYRKDKCVNISSNSLGGDGKNCVPPILTRDDTIRCNIKTKDISNITKLLKILTIEKVATYYNVHPATLRRICKQAEIPYKKNYTGVISKVNLKGVRLAKEKVAEFVLDAYKLNDFELGDKYGVNRKTALRWRQVYGVNRVNRNIRNNENKY